MVALLVQSMMGMVSDRSRLPWGRRRPFILIGTLLNVGVIAAIGLIAGMDGLSGYLALFILMLLLQFAANTAHGAAQGLIPDLVPKRLRGRYSGVKAILEIPLPVILVSFTTGRLIAAGSLWAALGVVILVLLFAMAVSMFAPEVPLESAARRLDWQPFIRLVLMTAVFTLIILGLGQAVRIFSSLADLPRSAQIAFVGAAGLLAMIAAIGFGVWACIQIGLGSAAKAFPGYSWWVINRLAFLTGATNLASFAVFFIQGRLGIPDEQAAGPASQLIMVVGIFILLLGLPGGWLADRFGRIPLVIGSGLLAALGAVLIILARGMGLIYAGGLCIGAAAGLFYTANWALGTDLVPRSEAGRFLGISNLAGAGAGAIGAYIGGSIADSFTMRYPDTPGLGYAVLFAIYAAIFLFSTFAAGRISAASPQNSLA
jgi:MFS family permease